MPRTIPGSKIVLADSGSPNYIVYNGAYVYNHGAPTPGVDKVVVGDGCEYSTPYYGSLDIIFTVSRICVLF